MVKGDFSSILLFQAMVFNKTQEALSLYINSTLSGQDSGAISPWKFDLPGKYLYYNPRTTAMPGKYHYCSSRAIDQPGKYHYCGHKTRHLRGILL